MQTEHKYNRGTLNNGLLWIPDFICLVQWGSEYRTSLVFEWSKVVRSSNGPFFEWHLNTRLNFVCYSNHHLKTGPVFKWWSEYRTPIWIPDIWIPDKWKFVIQIFPLFRFPLYSDAIKIIDKNVLYSVYFIIWILVKFVVNTDTIWMKIQLGHFSRF